MDRKISETDEPAAIFDLLPLVFGRSDAAAAATVHKLLRTVPSRDLPWFDCSLRQRLTFELHGLKAAQVVKLERFGEASVSLLGLTSFHANGYIREAAIRRLSLITSGAEVPFLIVEGLLIGGFFLTQRRKGAKFGPSASEV